MSVLLAFLQLFIVMDAFALLPIFIMLTKHYPVKFRKECANSAVYVAGLVLFVFLFFGIQILNLFSISFESFKIAGGLVLLIIGLKIVLGLHFREEHYSKYDLAYVPLATPLITGPGVITTVIILVGQFGYYVTALASILNLVTAWLILHNSELFFKFLGRQGSAVLSRIMGLLLTAFGVQYVLIGLGI